MGAGLLHILLLLSLLPLGCGRGDQGSPDPERQGARALGLKEGARVHQVILGGRGSEEHVLPLRLEAAPGDAVEFVTVDNRVHTVGFPADSLAPEVRDFLQETSQAESPPLVARGSRFLLLLEGAPAGEYPFVSRGHGGVAHGMLLIRGSASEGDPPREGPEG